jgi:RNA polymerase sigma factor (sigma-70 family)
MSKSVAPTAPQAPPLAEISTRLSSLTQPEALVQRYGQAIRGYLQALLRDPDDVEDAVQDFMVKILDGQFQHWPGTGRFRDYLKTAVRNAACDFLRQKGRAKQAGNLEQLPDRGSAAGESGDVWLDLYRRAVLDAAFRQLRSHQEGHEHNVFCTLLRLRAEDGDAASTELADRLSRATGRAYTAENTRQQLHRARRLFAELLVEEVRQALGEPANQDIAAELQSLGLMTYVAEFMPLGP